MSELASFFQELIVLYCTAAVGYIAKRSGVLEKESDEVITRVILYITLPALILYSLNFPYSVSLIKDFGALIFLSVFVLCTACIIAYYVVKKSSILPEKRGIYQGLIIFGNQGFLGYAVCSTLFSKEGIMYAAVFNIFYLIMIWTYGIYIIVKNTKTFYWRTLLLNPGIIATTLGLFVFFMPFEWPEAISKFLSSLGSPTTPLSMILTGSLVANIDLKQILNTCKDSYLWIAGLLKLCIAPALLLPFTVLGMKPELIAIAVLITGMPSAPTTSLYAKRYGGDAQLASVGVCITTFLALLTLPLLYGILRLLLW